MKPKAPEKLPADAPKGFAVPEKKPREETLRDRFFWHFNGSTDWIPPKDEA